MVKLTAQSLRAAKLLHDEIGPLLSAAGLRLQLIRMDFPETAKLVGETTSVLDQAIDAVRELTRELGTVPLASVRRQAKTATPQKAKRKSK
jgi:signal transduction histidine kinase